MLSIAPGHKVKDGWCGEAGVDWTTCGYYQCWDFLSFYPFLFSGESDIFLLFSSFLFGLIVSLTASCFFFIYWFYALIIGSGEIPNANLLIVKKEPLWVLFFLIGGPVDQTNARN